MISEGHHKARATEGALGYTSSGSEQVAVRFEIKEGEHKGASITWYGYFTEKTTERTIESLRHCGWVGDRIDRLDGIDANEVMLVVEHETDEKGTRARVRWINSAEGGGLAMKERMDEGAAAAFAQKMRAHVITHDKAKGAKPQATSGRPAGRQAQRPAPQRNGFGGSSRGSALVDPLAGADQGDDPLPF